MKISMHIEDATPAILMALSKIANINSFTDVRSKNAPYGLKKDGTPAKRRGRPALKNKKSEVKE